MPSLNRLSALLIIVTLGLVSFFAFPWPSRSIAIAGRDLNISGRVLVAAIVLGLVATGAQALAGGEQRNAPQYAPLVSCFWILPTLACAVALVAPNQIHEVSAQLLVCSATVATLVVLIVVEHYTVAPHSAVRLASRTIVKVAAFFLMTLLMTALRTEQTSGLLLGAVAGVCGAGVTCVMLGEELASPWRTVGCAAASGLILGFVARAVAPMVTTSIAYGLVLTIVLYALVGILRGYVRGQVRKKVVIEYLLVAAIGLLIVMVSGR